LVNYFGVCKVFQYLQIYKSITLNLRLQIIANTIFLFHERILDMKTILQSHIFTILIELS